MNANSARFLAVVLSLTGDHIVFEGAGQSAKAAGPLRVHPETRVTSPMEQRPRTAR